jgi:hypothetical protein
VTSGAHAAGGESGGDDELYFVSDPELICDPAPSCQSSLF